MSVSREARAGAILGTVAVGGTAVLASYALALGNVGNLFPPIPGEAATTSYLDTPFWLGVPRSTVIAMSVIQVMAAIGFVVLVLWRALAAEEPTNGVLAKLPAYLATIITFLLASALWPYLARWALGSPSGLSVGACVASLIVAAVAVILIVADAFESDATPWYALVGALVLGTVVVLGDGVGWSARLIYQFVHDELPKQL